MQNETIKAILESRVKRRTQIAGYALTRNDMSYVRGYSDCLDEVIELVLNAHQKETAKLAELKKCNCCGLDKFICKCYD